MKYTIEQLKKQKIAIHCPTQEDWDRLMIYFESENIKWCDGKFPTSEHYNQNDNYVELYKTPHGTLGKICIDNFGYWKIITVSELFEDNKKEEKMKKSIYKADNKQDVKELFAIFDNIYKNITSIKSCLESSFELQFIDGNTDLYCTGGNLSFAIDFCGKTEITRPVDESEWIGRPCLFWNPGWSFISDKVIGILIKINDGNYYTENMQRFYCCRPLTHDEWAKYEPKN